MSSALTPISEQSVMANIGITEQDVERRKRFVGLVPEDLERIAGIRELVVKHAEQLTTTFFDYVARFEEARVLL